MWYTSNPMFRFWYILPMGHSSRLLVSQLISAWKTVSCRMFVWDPPSLCYIVLGLPFHISSPSLQKRPENFVSQADENKPLIMITIIPFNLYCMRLYLDHHLIKWWLFCQLNCFIFGLCFIWLLRPDLNDLNSTLWDLLWSFQGGFYRVSFIIDSLFYSQVFNPCLD